VCENANASDALVLAFLVSLDAGECTTIPDQEIMGYRCTCSWH